MAHKKFPNMLSPIKIREKKFKNRVIASPITANRIVDHGYPTPEGIDAYETKSRGGFGVVTITESFVDKDYAARHEHGLNIYSKQMTTFHMESIMTLTEAIKAHGAIASIQLNHVGAINHPEMIKDYKNPIGPSSFIRDDGIQIDEMSFELMENVANNYAEAALNCKALGFDMVNIHGGHGWLLSQFLSPKINKRIDEYGGSMENRARFPIMVCNRIKELCGEDFLIEYRMSGSERIEGGMTIDDGIEFARIIKNHVDLIHVTSGVYYDHVGSKAFSSMFDEHGCNLDLAEAIKKNVDIPVVAVGGFNRPEQIENALVEGKCDFVALGRQQFADPEFVNKALMGLEDEIAPCLRCSCFNPLVPNPDSRPIPSLWSCAVNPKSNRELRWRLAPKPNVSRKVLVIGGGVSGMYGAITAAERGHNVVLVEKSDKLGGQLWFTDYDSHKESLKGFRDSLIAKIKRLKIDVKLNIECTPEYINSLNVDAVITAVGSTPVIPKIKGIEKAYYATKPYKDIDLVKDKKVIMIGGGAIGCETGYFYVDEYNSKMTILEIRDDILKDSNDSQRQALIPRMKNLNMDFKCLVKIKEIMENGVSFINSDRCDEFVECDTVLYACGSSANEKLVEEFSNTALWNRAAGDCNKARMVINATYEAFCAAMDII
jgi:2,4-dienoyl-CoA reductase-like NADH-dependent reductase (Old Yellow Enzyme family)/thioredoxin reductase